MRSKKRSQQTSKRKKIPEILIVFGSRVREERLRLHLTQIQLGVRCEMTGNHIGMVERAEVAISLDRAEKIAKALGKDFQLFLR